jgi:hypothetical protein
LAFATNQLDQQGPVLPSQRTFVRRLATSHF